MEPPKTCTKPAYVRRQRTRDADTQAVQALHEAITDDLDNNVPYKTLMDITGMSRERLRMIAHEVRARRAEQAN